MENSCLKLPFPGWEIVRELGRDGCETWYEIQNTDADGNVHRATLRHLSIPLSEDEACAWKDQLPQDSRGTAIYCSPVETLAAELRQLCAWGTHPGIALPMDYAMIQRKDGLGWDVFICAPLLPSLEEYSSRELSDEAQIVQMAVELCDALSACHQRGLLHRNIQPRSILCTEDGHFQLGNFGGVQSLEITKATSPYIAPEVHFGKTESVQSDIYALGLVLYWLLNENRLPFLPLPPKPVQQNHMEAAKMRRMRGERLPSPANGSPGLQKIILKACAYEPEKRFATAQELKNALLALADAVPTPEPLPPQPAHIETFQPKAEMPPKRPVYLWLCAALCAGVVLGLTVYFGVHFWQDATCTAPQTCALCGKTRGEALPHEWAAATCTSPQTCVNCGKTQGTAQHAWLEATCNEPETCARCGATRGEPLPHDWQSIYRGAMRVCRVCGKREMLAETPLFEPPADSGIVQ